MGIINKREGHEEVPEILSLHLSPCFCDLLGLRLRLRLRLSPMWVGSVPVPSRVGPSLTLLKPLAAVAR
jgi:hypothetical protein